MAISVQKLGNQPGSSEKAMSGDEFRAWEQFMGFRTPATMRALGISRNTVTAYRQKGADEQVRRACRAIALVEKKDAVVEVTFSFGWEAGL